MVSSAIAFYFYKEILSIVKNCGTSMHKSHSWLIGIIRRFLVDWWL